MVSQASNENPGSAALRPSGITLLSRRQAVVMKSMEPPDVTEECASAGQVCETVGGASHDDALRELRPPAGIFGRLWFMLGDDDELFVENIKSGTPGWGTAMLLRLGAMYPARTRWTASSINTESEVFWDKMRSRHGIDLKVGATRPDRR